MTIFQCQGILLFLHIVGQGPAVLGAVGGRMGYIFHLSSLSNVLSFGRRLRLALVNLLLEGLSLPRNNATIN